MNNPSASVDNDSRSLASEGSMKSKIVMINGKVHEEIQITDDYQLIFLITNSHNITLLPSYGIGSFSNF